MNSMMFMNMIMINMILNLIPSYNKNLNPLIMSLNLLMLAIMSSLNINLLSNYSMCAFIMYLIIIGGLMIMFLYFTSFINNLKMMIKWNYLIMLPIKFYLMFLTMIMFLLNINLILSWIKLNEINSMNFINYLNQMNLNIEIMYMYMFNKNFITILSMIYLFMCLTLIVKMYINKKMSLRKIN
uniref:NADH dehydrogenase subunit 6 n=1 Tax=Megaphragma amalphitanum TaxID=1735703 RepID=A0A0P0CC33_9HYME|nr:NADH dehydrogenase subunit 6 [Megaphragma amalphitanum]ALI86578.1 NADH dehydrogenase subunit 6 [Megaphragma amalphitanum]